jgi:hypothetical protein
MLEEHGHATLVSLLWIVTYEQDSSAQFIWLNFHVLPSLTGILDQSLLREP